MQESGCNKKVVIFIKQESGCNNKNAGIRILFLIQPGVRFFLFCFIMSPLLRLLPSDLLDQFISTQKRKQLRQ